MSAIRELQLSRPTVTRRIEVMSQDIADKLKHDIMECTYFSLQFDESTDMTDTAQLCIFIRMVFNDMLAKEEFLTIIPLKGKTRGEVLNTEEIMGIATKIVNSIRARSLQRRLFQLQLEDRESAEHTDLVLHTDVRWLSRGKFLERFQELLPEITAFLDERGDDTQILKNEKWLTDLAFLTDITMHLNSVNLELQDVDGEGFYNTDLTCTRAARISTHSNH
ncbi:protein FAM200A-like [Cimex lectularius]|uniref:Zinc finger BED domain-containing protein 5 n=1 Tax=Cimex lectularius TaxID=79782 RepID=A0A8I6R7S7_CIMLE|nr:protein FAM200A-like [Cimex lectularius]